MIGDIKSWLGDMVSGDIKNSIIANKEALLALNEAQFEQLKAKFLDIQKSCDEKDQIIADLMAKVEALETRVSKQSIKEETTINPQLLSGANTVLLALTANNSITIQSLAAKTNRSVNDTEAFLSYLMEAKLVSSSLSVQVLDANMRVKKVMGYRLTGLGTLKAFELRSHPAA